jgi:hypothetical protein
MKRIIAALSIVLALVLTAFTMQSATSKTSAAADNTTPTAVVENTFLINRAKMFTAALAVDKDDVIVGMIIFPLEVILKDGTRQIADSNELMSIFGTLFDNLYKEAFSNIDLAENASSTPENGLIVSNLSYSFTLNKSGKVIAVSNPSVSLAVIGYTPTPAPSATPSIDNCYNSAISQEAMAECAEKELDAAKATLDSLVTELMPMMIENQQYFEMYNDDYNQADAMKLVAAEWETTAADHCEWEASLVGGGTVQPLWNIQCQTRQIKILINEVRGYLCSMPVGDCPQSLKYKQDL